MNNIRSMVRPLVTVLLVLALVYGFIVGIVTPDAFIPIVAGALSYWFASRENKPVGRD